MADITMNVDETLELDTIIESSSRASNSVTNVDSSFEQTGIQTHTNILNPTKPGNYTIKVNGQELSIKVNDSTTIPDNVVAKSNLVAWYPFENSVADETAGDSSYGDTNDYKLSENGNVSNDSSGGVSDILTQSKDSSKYSFNGSGGFLSDDDLSGAYNNYSACIWVNSTTTQFQSIFEIIGGTNQIESRMFTFRMTDQGNAEEAYAIGKSTSVTIDDGSWHHLAFTWDDGSLEGSLYVDGNLEVSGPSDTQGGSLGLTTVGARYKTNNGSRGGYWDGSADDARVYNTTLTDTQVSNIYENTKP